MDGGYRRGDSVPSWRNGRGFCQQFCFFAKPSSRTSPHCVCARPGIPRRRNPCQARKSTGTRLARRLRCLRNAMRKMIASGECHHCEATRCVARSPRCISSRTVPSRRPRRPTSHEAPQVGRLSCATSVALRLRASCGAQRSPCDMGFGPHKGPWNALRWHRRHLPRTPSRTAGRCRCPHTLQRGSGRSCCERPEARCRHVRTEMTELQCALSPPQGATPTRQLLSARQCGILRRAKRTRIPGIRAGKRGAVR
mmetsp:Transcript_102619/g.289996  ORF Transcript_102619/g.289996 Transcript_102619/m.289996 type:complete len:253 (-) Transcript_102619:1057-1815(-)